MKQRPQFLAEKLSQSGCEVTFLTVGAGKNGFFTPRERLTVCEMAFVRGYMRSRLIRLLSRLMIGRRLRGMEFDAVILTDPVQFDMLPEKLRSKPIIYDCMDLIPHFYKGAKRRLSQRAEKRLCRQAAHITVASKGLGEHLMRRYSVEKERLTLLNNALEPDDISAADGGIELLHPAIVYMGAVESWVDIELLQRFFADRPELNLYIIGDGSAKLTDRLQKLKNCRCLGKKEHIEALSYLKSADAALLPFKKSELVEMVDPIKLYEYLALGKSTVCLHWAETERFKGCKSLFFYENAAEFADAVHLALKSGDCAPTGFLEGCTWQARAKQLLDIIDRLCAEKR